MKKIGGAIIGFGGMGNFHAQKMQTVKGIELLGVYDINPERHAFAAEQGIKAYASRKALLADPKVDLVVVATPNDVHKSIVIDCLKAGKNVICEKPVTMKSSDLEDMIAAANAAGKLFTVHQNRRWDGDYLSIRNVIESGELGQVFRIESRVQGSRGIPSGWREVKKCGGGMLLDWGVHLLDQMLQMTGGKKLISIDATFTNITNQDCDDGFSAFFRFEGGLEWVVEVGTCNFVALPRWYVCGSDGSAVINTWDCKGTVRTIFNRDEDDAAPIQAGTGITRTMAPRNERTVREYPVKKIKSGWTEYYKNVIATLNGKADIVVTHEQLRRTTKLIELIFKAQKQGKTLMVNKVISH